MHPFFLTLIPEALLLAHTAYKEYFPVNNEPPAQPTQLISKPTHNKLQSLQNLLNARPKKAS